MTAENRSNGTNITAERIESSEMIRSLQGLLGIDSVGRPGEEGTPFGKGAAQALDYVLELCGRLGFRTKNCGGMVGYAEIGEGEELMGILVHLDVVPAGGGWDYEPFAGTVADGKLFGRGVVDDKGPAVTCIYAMKDVLNSGAALGKRVRIIFGLSEETGDWDDMEYYKQTEEIPSFGFTPDADFPAIYGEKGILQLLLSMPSAEAGFDELEGGAAPNMVADFCKATLKTVDGGLVSLEEKGRSAHGSTPGEGENAVSKLMARVGELIAEGRVNKADCGLARFYNEAIGFDIHGERAGCFLKDEQSGSLTLNVGMAGMKDGRTGITIDIRYPVTFTLDDVKSGLERAAAPYGVSVEVMEHMKPVYMDKDGSVISALMEVYREATGDDTEASVMGGGTYARAMENIVAFGPVLPGRECTEHKKNEYLYLEDLEKMREIYGKAILRLAVR